MDHGEPVPELDELYDEATLAALDRYHPVFPARTTGDPRREPGSTRGGGLAGVLLTATAFALRDLLEPEADESAIEEFVPEDRNEGAKWVTYLHVPGAPHASRITVRPWLAPSFPG